MKKNNGEEYSVNSVRAAVAAINRHLQRHSKVEKVDLYDLSTFRSFIEVTSGKIKFLTDLGHGEVKGADAFTDGEIQQILSHICMDGSTPARLLRRLFFFNVCLLGLRGGEHHLLNASSFKKRDDGGYDVVIYRSKTNQRGFISNKGKADHLILPNQPEIIKDYERYFTMRPANCDNNFYLQEVDEEFGQYLLIIV
jgi:hypothetical protein